MSPDRRRVAVVGAGWGGLAAATALTRSGHEVTVYEAGAEPGGRARAVELGGRRLDNGQHLLIGAYRETLAAIGAIGLTPASVLERRPLALELVGHGRRVELRLPRHGGRGAFVGGLLGMRGVGLRDRLRGLARMPGLRRLPVADGPADAWLRATGQPDSLIADLWSPLCLAALNAPPAAASARLFAAVLRETFADRAASDLLLPLTDLGAVFPRPAVDWLLERGQHVCLQHRVRAIERAGDGWSLDDDQGRFDDVVLATGPVAAARLLSGTAGGAEAAARLRALGCAPIATIYLDTGARQPLGPPLQGRLDGPAQWLFDRGPSGHPGVVAAVISGRGEHETMSREALGRAVADQLREALPGSRTPRVIGVVREKRATFDPRPGVEVLRPGSAGPVEGLWHAGDHVAGGLPATIEGAVRSGHACAAAIDQQGESRD